MTRRAAVVGAGVAGLTAAVELHRAGFEVTVFEAAPAVAGLASSERDADGYQYDSGPHFMTNRLAAAIGITPLCDVVHRYGESVVLGSETISYPEGLLRKQRFVRSALAERVRPRRTDGSVAEWFRANYGTALADEVAIPLVEKWSGVPGSQLAEAVGNKIPASVAETVWLKVARKALHRPIAIGYCGSQPQSAGVWHVFARDGIAELCRALVAALPDGVVRTSSPVTAITVDGGSGQRRVTGVEGPWGSMAADLVMTTAPANVLPHLVPDAPEIADLSRLRYRPMVFVNLKLEGRGVMDDTVLWIPQRDKPFFRLTDTTDAMPPTAPAGHSVICVDYGATVGDEVWAADDDALIASTTEHLRSVLPEVARRVHGGFVQRIKAAYPVFDMAYEDVRQRFAAHGSGIAGLESIGRNGEFDHLLMEDVYWRTRWRVHALAA